MKDVRWVGHVCVCVCVCVGGGGGLHVCASVDAGEEEGLNEICNALLYEVVYCWFHV